MSEPKWAGNIPNESIRDNVYSLRIDSVDLEMIIAPWYLPFGKTQFFINQTQIIPQKVKGKRRRLFLYQIAKDRSIYIQNHVFGDPLPDIIVNEKLFSSRKTFTFFERVIAYAPFLLVAKGGVLGGIFGVMAMYSNCKILRLKAPLLKKAVLIVASYLITSLLFLISAIVFIIIITAAFGLKR